MGCINSKRKENENFRVKAVQIPGGQCGYLELTPRELYFYSSDCTVCWGLQHLRRYGTGDGIFSFEAGRRCMTGAGIYTFRCAQADALYQIFQRYVNQGVTVDDPFHYSGPTSDREHPSHTLSRGGGGVEALNTSNTNNYLEPAISGTAGGAGGGGGGLGMGTFRTTMMRDSFSSSLSLDLDSPDSVPSLSFTNEVVHFQSQQSTTARLGGVAGGGSGAYGNVYLEQPFRQAQTERNNNNNNNNTTTPTTTTNICMQSNSGFNTVNGKCVDGPPEECAPILSPTLPESLHMYANVDNLGAYKRNCAALRSGSSIDKSTLDTAERCYENLTHSDISLLLHSHSSMSSELLARGETPSAATATSTVNYIVLDLDQPRSPTQCSPKAGFGSGLSLATDRVDATPVHATILRNPTTTTQTNSAANAIEPTSSSSTAKTKSDEISQQLSPPPLNDLESSRGYSTIDFIKTCALIKASNAEPDEPESRITRHSHNKCKAYSISE